MTILMPIRREPRVLKPTAVNVLRAGIEQAKAAHTPYAMIRRLEEKLVTEGLIDLFEMQNQPHN